MAIIRKVTFESANRKKDRSVSLRFVTSLEQSTDEFMEIDKMIAQSGVIAFSERSQLTTQELKELDQVEIEIEGKSKSQRLRSVLFIYHRQQKLEQSFNDYYAQKMEELIEHFKSKLEDET